MLKTVFIILFGLMGGSMKGAEPDSGLQINITRNNTDERLLQKTDLQTKLDMQKERAQWGLDLTKNHQQNFLPAGDQQQNISLQNSYDMLFKQARYIHENIILSKKQVKVGIFDINYINLNIYIDPSVTRVTLDISAVKYAKICIYAWHNPIINKNTIATNYAEISNVMIPPRKYSFHIASLLCGLAVLYYWWTE